MVTEHFWTIRWAYDASWEERTITFMTTRGGLVGCCIPSIDMKTCYAEFLL